MNKTRVIPVLLLRNKGLVKTVKFKDPKYVGDPINSVRIFNEKEVDELVFLDITATPEGREPNFDMLQDIAGEAFMPMAYGGGLTSIEQVRRVFSLGFEKVVLNTAGYTNPSLISEAVSIYGAQSVVGCVDVRRTLLGRYELYIHSGAKRCPGSLGRHLAELERLGVGEILVNSIDRDGTQAGYDLKLLREVSHAVSVPVIACGGASSIDDFVAAVHEGGVSAVAAGSLFVFMGPHRAVLINYPDRKLLTQKLP
ncbi:MAG: Imidazole glycerol phosphate synthase subunit HisF [Candidatus Accumulibacter regalis]|jgi:cyclase|uniref:imidazole glycerol-phosphate synthase n=1 Tax=Accumulibacter regalis TaxID=522306 RepID=A0A011PIK5_ACCRE|nr:MULTISPECIES: AglZ/HisF2 family acetamidino modification protein [unclassified Candidatus Accumulibacter]EXI87376.1 MAG: Imidazole glycerol phosphate synthase subunit HisF [Candidatus Accumulibacter regalis]MBL8368300.1 imidazole glycerol phosphate synthase subunit HisF [Accumulibacter sp.]HRE72437.1 AglZ/HisF2 family acetamidino modification protein [Accumulibacter sp.]